MSSTHIVLLTASSLIGAFCFYAGYRTKLPGKNFYLPAFLHFVYSLFPLLFFLFRNFWKPGHSLCLRRLLGLFCNKELDLVFEDPPIQAFALKLNAFCYEG
jgi:hypothetical protein